jgi:predicted RNase H-like HicB family nuclease
MKLTIRILRNEEGGYTAVCPTLPGCISKAPTREEATDQLDEAIRGYIAAVNNFVPEKLTHEVTEV